MPKDPTPKLCECGCGQPTNRVRQASTAEGYARGDYRRFLSGHNGRRIRKPLLTTNCYHVEDRGHDSPCWIWTKSKSTKGYGIVWHPVERRNVGAHRRMYEQEIGPIPPGLVIDHLCRQPACINPAHLEPVENAENQLRGVRFRIPDDRIEAVREIAKSEGNVNAICRQTGLSHPTVTAIVRGTYWR